MIEPREIEDQLLAFLRREVFSPEIALDSETDLIATGFDSLSLVRMLLFIEKKYGRWIPESQLTDQILRNTRTLSAAVSELLNES